MGLRSASMASQIAQDSLEVSKQLLDKGKDVVTGTTTYTAVQYPDVDANIAVIVCIEA